MRVRGISRTSNGGPTFSIGRRPLDAPQNIAAQPPPVLRQHRKAHVIAPSPGNLHIAARIPFAEELKPRHQRERTSVRRLYVDLDAMEPQLAKCDVADKR